MSLFKQNLFFKLTACIFCSISLLGLAPAQAATEAIPVASFFKHPKFREARLSPDGKSIGMLMLGANDRVILAVLEVGQLKPEVIANYEDKDVRSFHWINNDRLVYDLTNYQHKDVEQFFGPGLYAVNKDRSKRLRLVTHQYTSAREKVTGPSLAWHTYFLDVVHGSSTPDVYVQQAQDSDSRTYDLYRLNTMTGNTELIKRPGKVSKWLIDKSGVPRIAETIDGAESTVFYMDPKTNAWRKLASSPWTSNARLDPTFFSPEGDLYVRAYNGKNTRALYRFDLEKNQLDGEPVLELKGYDFDGGLIYSDQQKKVLGIRYEMSKPATRWFDTVAAERQKKIDALLPDTVNMLTFADDSKASVAIIHSYSDTNPGVWQLYDFASDKLVRLGSSNPDIQPEQMATKEMLRYPARDGLEIPAYLTLPVNGNGKNLPTIVLVHGGPYVRGGHWNWNPQVQFLASRGYAVIEPDFRGSTGFGVKHFDAGMKQWGLAMQDDVADAAKWAIAKGYADPNRICIAGASYGGYATLMGLIKDPDLFRCGIEWVGVTDINLLYNIHWSDASDEWKWYGMPVLIGDQTKDAAQLKATSPLENAAKLTRPLLMAYGTRDRRVPIEHGTKFYRAVKEKNADVEWVEYAEEGHGFYLLKNNIDFWGRVEKFLDKNIGKTP
ncbi:S9 family peptidase [Undibacterium sp. CY18W]|uniref:S9 family peptidase n=1 Tax=Undibacterium hunanense TaxID=2762292 RepID=A0ABR6ZS74_9BURK|nr:alpha/beta fold hydrolase [Undibacterium hunanense]MBC3918725.1 S9 family peptidase [Undibacterium hunanense]